MIHVLLVVAAAAAGSSLVLLAVNLAMLPRLSRVRPRVSGLPRVSIIIPARNEELSIEATVRSHLGQAYPDFEVIVVDDRSTDRTGEILARLARENPRLTIVPGTDPPSGWLGKPNALALGARRASGEVLLFSDADVVYGPTSLARAVTLLEENRIDLVAVVPHFETRGFWENVLMPFLTGAVYLGFGFLVNLDRPRWFGGGAGAGNLVRRPVYDSIGGHEAIRDSVVDDVRLGLNARRAGYRTRAVRAEDLVSVRMYRGFREVFDGFTKNVAYAFDGLLGVAFAGITLLTLIMSLGPIAVLLAALFGAPIPVPDALLALAAYGLLAVARLSLALALGDPLWPAWTHPIMTAVWAGIIYRSLYSRIVRRRLTWRGRQFDARAARF